MARFRDYDGMARLGLAGSLAASVAFLLPWVTLRLGLLEVAFSGVDLVVSPATLQRIGSPVGLAGTLLVAAGAFVALVAALAGLVLAVAPGLRASGPLNAPAALRLGVAGFAASAVSLAAMVAWVGPQVGRTAVEYGAGLALLGFLLAIVAWPRARLLGAEEGGALEPEAAAPGASAPPSPPR